MKSTKNLRLRLRLMEGALLLLFGVFTTAAVSTHQLLLDAANHPTSAFDLTSTNLTGTLSDARLPASVPLLSNGGLTIPGEFSSAGSGFTVDSNGNADANGLIAGDNGLLCGSNLTVEGSASLDNGSITTDGIGNIGVQSLGSYGNLYVTTYTQLDNGEISTDGDGNLDAGSYSVGGSPFTDGNSLYLGGGFVTDGASLYLGGNLYTDGVSLTLNGTETVFRPSDSGFLVLTLNSGFGVWGHAVPTSKPATPTTLAQAIAVLQAYGLCQ